MGQKSGRPAQVCVCVFRRVSGGADSAFPGAAAGGPGRLRGSRAGGHEAEDPQTANLRHHERPGRDQIDREGVGQQGQMDVSSVSSFIQKFCLSSLYISLFAFSMKHPELLRLGESVRKVYEWNRLCFQNGKRLPRCP